MDQLFGDADFVTFAEVNNGEAGHHFGQTCHFSFHILSLAMYKTSLFSLKNGPIVGRNFWSCLVDQARIQLNAPCKFIIIPFCEQIDPMFVLIEKEIVADSWQRSRRRLQTSTFRVIYYDHPIPIISIRFLLFILILWGSSDAAPTRNSRLFITGAAPNSTWLTRARPTASLLLMTTACGSIHTLISTFSLWLFVVHWNYLLILFICWNLQAIFSNFWILNFIASFLLLLLRFAGSCRYGRYLHWNVMMIFRISNRTAIPTHTANHRLLFFLVRRTTAATLL